VCFFAKKPQFYLLKYFAVPIEEYQAELRMTWKASQAPSIMEAKILFNDHYETIIA
jgi:hypothetical protein